LEIMEKLGKIEKRPVSITGPSKNEKKSEGPSYLSALTKREGKGDGKGGKKEEVKKNETEYMPEAFQKFILEHPNEATMLFTEQIRKFGRQRKAI